MIFEQQKYFKINAIYSMALILSIKDRNRSGRQAGLVMGRVVILQPAGQAG